MGDLSVLREYGVLQPGNLHGATTASGGWQAAAGGGRSRAATTSAASAGPFSF